MGSIEVSESKNVSIEVGQTGKVTTEMCQSGKYTSVVVSTEVCSFTKVKQKCVGQESSV